MKNVLLFAFALSLLTFSCNLPREIKEKLGNDTQQQRIDKDCQTNPNAPGCNGGDNNGEG